MINSKDSTTSNTAPDGKEFARLGGKNLVYVRPVIAADVMDDLTDGEEFDVEIPAETVLYALHAADGARIALMGNRDLAFAAARQNEMTPVSVH
ncbi:DUF1150 domain-containing protein [Parvularcula sp. IMCC14364]|uniref:DUF1150 domain-containing protein n=1 Tax=Parvularcula sp. IMCC14364 TaxID=3067902 RepID=UPI002740B847|nr:DUF1150 domain-containing protein [Parvularcula sp. IMCC14364]